MPARPSPRPAVGSHSRHDVIAQQTDDPSLARVGGFSDAVFAFAITLLILAIRIPHPTDADANQGLLTLLAQQRRRAQSSHRG